MIACKSFNRLFLTNKTYPETMKSILTLFLLLAFPLLAEPNKSSEPKKEKATKTASPIKPAKVVKRRGKFIDYESDNFKGIGYLVLPEGASAEKPVPGVIVVHEWWGQDNYVRKRAEMLADLGYAAFAIDMYGECRHTTVPLEAGHLMVNSFFTPYIARQRFEMGMKTLQAQPQVDSTQIAAIGYSVGGLMALQMAVHNSDLLAIAAFHSGPNIDISDKVKSIKAKLLVCHGEADSLIPEEDIAEFKANMKQRNADLTFESYPGVTNGFTNPASTALGKKHETDAAYNKEADEKSWTSLKKLLSSAFSGPNSKSNN